MDIRSAIKTIAGSPSRQIVVGTVTRAEGDHVDVQPADATAAPLLNIDLDVDPSPAITFRPPVGATVLVCLDSPTTGFVVAASKCPVIINGGELGPLVRLSELQDNLDALKDYVTALYDALLSAFTAVGASTAANGAAGTTSLQQSMAARSINFKDMADNNVKH